MTIINADIDTDFIANNFAKAHASYGKAAIVQQQICQELTALLPDIRPTSVLEIGCGVGNLTALYAPLWQPSQLYLNDLYPAIMDNVTYCRTDHLIGDIESMDLPAVNAVVSSSALQWIKDLSRLMGRIHRALDDGGVLAFSSFGVDNLRQIKELTGVGLDYYTLDETVSILRQMGFDVTVAKQKVYTLSFDDPKAILHHIKDTGVAVGGRTWTKSSLAQFYDVYHERFAAQDEQGKWHYPLTYDAVFFIANKA